MTGTGPTLKARLRADLTTAMKARDTLTTGTLRMALAAVGVAEVAGDTARELSDAEVVAVLGKEIRKRKEAAEAFAGAGRAELAERERAESDVLTGYLPAQLGEQELAGWVAEEIENVARDTGGPVTQRQMGLVVKAVQARAAGRAEGGRIAAAVRAALA